MQGYLVLDNVEITNSARTLAYLSQFMPVQVMTPTSCVPCSALAGTFGSPYSDPAPWYDASRPESAFFYGVLLDSLESASPLTRSTKQLASGGQSIGQTTVKGRIVQASGAMYAASEQAMDYGVRWLGAALKGQCEDVCGLSTLCLLPACPDPGLPTRWRRLYDAGLIDGPVVAPIAGMNGCILRSVSWQIAASKGYLFAEPVTVLNQALVANVNACGIISTTQWLGDSTTRLTVTAGGPSFVQNLSVSLAPLRSNESCPSPTPPVLSFTVSQIPPGTKLSIDGARRRVEVVELASGLVVGGLNVIGTGGTPMGWMDIGPCARACVCAKATTVNSNTTVKLEQIDREI
jgi:hypothetical protein